MDSLDVSFDGSDDGKLEGLLLGFYWDLPMAKRLDLMKASNWYLMMVK